MRVALRPALGALLLLGAVLAAAATATAAQVEAEGSSSSSSSSAPSLAHAPVRFDSGLASAAAEGEEPGGLLLLRSHSPSRLRRGTRAADTFVAAAEADSAPLEDSDAPALLELATSAMHSRAKKNRAKAKAKARAKRHAQAEAAAEGAGAGGQHRSRGARRHTVPGQAPRMARSAAPFPSARLQLDRGWAVSPIQPRRAQQRLPAARLTGAASTLTRSNVRCVLCQFVVQKIKNQLTPADGMRGGGGKGKGKRQSLLELEAFSFASVAEQMRVESLVGAAAEAEAQAQAATTAGAAEPVVLASGGLPTVFEHGADPSRRFRHTDILAARAPRARFTQVRGAATLQQRAAYLRLYSSVYASFESLCATRMPLAYLPYCNDMLKSYRFFAQGLNYGDRAEQICMNGNFCDKRSYVTSVTHNAYQREPGDA